MKQELFIIYYNDTKGVVSNDISLNRLYGWTTSRSILKAFMHQRDSSKYLVERANYFKHISLMQQRHMIDMIKLRSNKLKTDVILLMTESEKLKVEMDIDRLIEEYLSFDQLIENTNIQIIDLVNIIINLRIEYSDALDVIGYHPAPVDYMFDNVDDMDEYYQYDLIEVDTTNLYPRDLHKLCLYSLESFIQVMKDQL